MWRFPRDKAKFNRWLDEVDEPQTVLLRPRDNPDPPASFHRSVLGYAGAKAAFEKVTGAGFDKDLLWRHLWGLAHLKKATANQKPSWYALPGLPLHTLRRFPQKVRDMADQIGQLGQQIQSDGAYGMTVNFLPLVLAGTIPGTSIEWSADGHVGREVGIGVRGVQADRARNLLRRHGELPKLAELPDLLRLYADYIDVVSKLTAHHAPKGAALLEAMMPLELIHAAKAQTGRYFIDEIATVLTAAYSAVGSQETVDPRNLKMQHWRRLARKK